MRIVNKKLKLNDTGFVKGRFIKYTQMNLSGILKNHVNYLSHS